MGTLNVEALLRCNGFLSSRFIKKKSDNLAAYTTVDSVVPITRDWLELGAHCSLSDQLLSKRGRHAITIFRNAVMPVLDTPFL